MLRHALLAVLLCGSAALATAQTAYVTDSLRLGLHEAADTSDQPFTNLVSGTELQVLERNANYARVRAPDGREGWVKVAFLVDAKPALARVLELEAEVETLTAGLAAASAAERTAAEELRRLQEQSVSSTGSAEAIQDTLIRLQAENRDFEQRLETYRRSLPLHWVIVALVVAFVGGFAGGLWWLDAAIRRRHGGFRIY